MTAILHKAFDRRSLLRGGAGILGGIGVSQLVGCQASDQASADAQTIPKGGNELAVPTAAELMSSKAARDRYKVILSKVFGHGLPKNRRDMHALVDSMKLSNSSIGHFAYTIPGNSLEHITVATEYWASEFNVGPFMVLESDASVGQNYYPIQANGKRVGEDKKVKSEWPAFTALCKPFPDYYIELNLQTNDTKSTYRDMFTANQGGFHHFAVITPNFAADKAIMEARYQPSSALITNVGAIYYDARKDVGCMFELLETNKVLDFLFLSSYELSKKANLKDYKKTFNIVPTDVSKPLYARGLTSARILSLVKWADTEGPLADTVDLSKL